jgi:hypothetical protein
MFEERGHHVLVYSEQYHTVSGINNISESKAHCCSKRNNIQFSESK